MGELQCRIVCPDKYIHEGRVASIILHTPKSELGLFPRHGPAIYMLGTGVARLNMLPKDGGGCYRIFISGGYAEVKEDLVLVLADYACDLDDIDTLYIDQRKKEHLRHMEQFDVEDPRYEYYANKVRLCDNLLKNAANINIT